MEHINFQDPFNFTICSIVLFVIIFIRYLIVAGGYHYLFFFLFRKKFYNRIIDSSPLVKKRLKKEIYWSGISAIIFALAGAGMVIMWQKGHTAIYSQINDYPIWYFVSSIFLTLFIQDSYYYWLHRWMHLPKVYRFLHRVHHKSVHTSVLTSFSFHPMESFLQAIIIPLIILYLPLHLYAILFILILMTISATINHAGVEIYPSGRIGTWFAKWFIGATHHDQHHRKFHYNYGLYFTIWDKWMGTESPRFEEQYKERTGGSFKS